MSAKKPGRKYEVELDYTYISKASVRKWVLAFFGALVAVVALVVWITHEPSLESRAASEIRNAESLVQKARGTPQAKSHAEEIEAAVRKLGEAHAAQDAKRPQEALNIAAEVQGLANRIIATVQESDAQLFDVGGKVEVERASRDRWEAARVGMRLFEGDFVKTGPGGTADIVSSDGTLFRIKPDSLFEVQKTMQISDAAPGQASRRSEVKLVFGTIDTATGERSRSTVKTDAGTADISSKSRVGVDVDAAKTTGVSAYGGSATLQTASGERIVLGERERITASRTSVGPRIKLPDAPQPLHPDNNVAYDFKKREPVTLRWSRVGDAARYRLQIAQSRLFIPDSMVVDLGDRVSLQAVVTVNDEGSYFWRVAALTKENVASEWSEVRRFKVLSEADLGGPDKPPPDLSVERPRPIGNLVIVTGKTEPGASVTVNAEPADTDSSGVFRKTITLNTEGFNTIVIKATNGAGKETVRKEIVNIQSF